MLEYQIGTKSKSYALHTFCILSAYFFKNIYNHTEEDENEKQNANENRNDDAWPLPRRTLF